ncbi:hypothetical protein DPEC_G00221150 [Dallia pectoralis]|uniref:Uncharacterized protein n=1 Tax=Dallia pectoralis TaxID=75939 RepID=A0ACC2G3G0_DALPE|nr:hypothetical protein DPEC_G00221150 [Dallia pectoralis]
MWRIFGIKEADMLMETMDISVHHRNEKICLAAKLTDSDIRAMRQDRQDDNSINDHRGSPAMQETPDHQSSTQRERPGMNR